MKHPAVVFRSESEAAGLLFLEVPAINARAMTESRTTSPA